MLIKLIRSLKSKSKSKSKNEVNIIHVIKTVKINKLLVYEIS